jgi:hypothetical protein
MADLLIDLNKSSSTYKDLVVQDNDLVINSGATAIQQDIIQRLSFFAGEWFLDNTQGLPWYQQILVKNPDQSKVDAIFRNAILATPGVVSLSQYSFVPNFAARLLTVSFIAQTTQGTVNYSGAIPPISGGTQ